MSHIHHITQWIIWYCKKEVRQYIPDTTQLLLKSLWLAKSYKCGSQILFSSVVHFVLIFQQVFAHSTTELSTSSRSSWLKHSQGLHSKFLVLAWALSTGTLFLTWSIQNELDLFLLATQTLLIAWYFYQNLQFSHNNIDKIMFVCNFLWRIVKKI